MKETYWEKFVATGRPEDYLNYRMKGGGSCRAEQKISAAAAEEQRGAQKQVRRADGGEQQS